MSCTKNSKILVSVNSQSKLQYIPDVIWKAFDVDQSINDVKVMTPPPNPCMVSLYDLASDPTNFPLTLTGECTPIEITYEEVRLGIPLAIAIIESDSSSSGIEGSNILLTALGSIGTLDSTGTPYTGLTYQWLVDGVVVHEGVNFTYVIPSHDSEVTLHLANIPMGRTEDTTLTVTVLPASCHTVHTDPKDIICPQELPQAILELRGEEVVVSGTEGFNIIADIEGLVLNPTYTWTVPSWVELSTWEENTELLTFSFPKGVYTSQSTPVDIEVEGIVTGVTIDGDAITLTGSHLFTVTNDNSLTVSIKSDSTSNRLCANDPSVTFEITTNFATLPYTDITWEALDNNTFDPIANRLVITPVTIDSSVVTVAVDSNHTDTNEITILRVSLTDSSGNTATEDRILQTCLSSIPRHQAQFINVPDELIANGSDPVPFTPIIEITEGSPSYADYIFQWTVFNFKKGETVPLYTQKLGVLYTLANPQSLPVISYSNPALFGGFYIQLLSTSIVTGRSSESIVYIPVTRTHPETLFSTPPYARHVDSSYPIYAYSGTNTLADSTYLWSSSEAAITFSDPTLKEPLLEYVKSGNTLTADANGITHIPYQCIETPVSGSVITHTFILQVSTHALASDLLITGTTQPIQHPSATINIVGSQIGSLINIGSIQWDEATSDTLVYKDSSITGLSVDYDVFKLTGKHYVGFTAKVDTATETGITIMNSLLLDG